MDVTDVTTEVERSVGAALLRLLRTTDVLGGLGGDLPRLAPAFAEECSRLIPRSQCLIGEVDEPDRRDLVVVGTSGPWAESHHGHRWPLVGTLAGLALQTGQPVESVRGDHDAEEREPLNGGAMATVRMIPLTCATDSAEPPPVIGVLAVVRPERLALLGVERRILDTYAEVVAMTLHRAGIRDASERAHGRLAAEVGASVAARSHFVHDVRGPLTALAGYAEMMREGVFGQDPAAWAKPIDVICSKVEEINSMLDGLLTPTPAAASGPGSAVARSGQPPPQEGR